MKYSILVLGASISISLFIRICCSLEANMDQTEDLFSGRAEEVYEKFLKYSLSHGSGRKNSNVPGEVNNILNDWIQELESIRNSIPRRTETSSRIHPVRHATIKTFNEEMCGSTNPPTIITPACDDPDGCVCDPEVELPQGCELTWEMGNYMRCKAITTIPPIPSHLKTLDLNETQIEKISETAFRNVSIERIRLFRNSKIDYIDPWAFHDVNELETLIIIGNQITYLAYDIYVGLDNVTFIDLGYNQISFEEYLQCKVQPIEKIRKVLPKLRFLTLSGNPLAVVPKQIFAGLRDTNLYALYLDNCYLKDIDEKAFTFLKSLEVLNLSNNPPTLVSPMEKFARTLRPLTSLTNVYMAGLGFTEFPMEALSHVSSQLGVLDLSKSFFHVLRYDVLSQFPNIRELYLDDSGIQIIEANAFEKNTRLSTLTLRDNPIHQFSSYFPPSLSKLNLTYSKPGDIITTSLSLHNLTELKYLDISGFKISRISTDIFKGLSEMRNLYINNCGIESIEDGAFQDLTKLVFLKLENNLISEITPNTFLGLENLETLIIRNSEAISSPFRIEKSSKSAPSEDGPFKFMPKLKTLDLEGNKISHLSSHLFQNLSELCYVHLSNNPIEPWDLKLFPNRTTINDEQLNASCFFEIYIKNGKLEFIKDAMIEDFLRAKVIDLTNNVPVCDIGACKTRDLIKSASLYNQQWINSGSYRCKDLRTNTHISLLLVTDKTCEENGKSENIIPKSGATVTIISVVASLTVVATVILILAYKNRAHLRYFWFTFKFNVIPLGSRKAKLSTMEDPTSESASYEYDVFISYHHDDSKFIGDTFLPEIEIQDENNHNNETGIIEAKNSIYLIENDEIIKNHNNNIIKAKSTTPRRFKVCLHERDFAAGVPITENIVDCVDRSRKTVIFVSKKYMESQWCSYELNLAYHRLVESRRKSFLLVLMEDVPSACRSKILSYLMASKTYLQWPGENGLQEDKTSFWKRLRTFLQSN